MTTVDVAMNVVHLIFAGIWAGGLTLMAGVVLPMARTGEIGADAVRGLGTRAVRVARLSAIVMLLSGGHLAANLYGGGALLGTGDGQLVVTMAGLWLVLIALTEIGFARLRRDPEEGLAAAHGVLGAAAAVGLALLGIGGLL